MIEIILIYFIGVGAGWCLRILFDFLSLKKCLPKKYSDQVIQEWLVEVKPKIRQWLNEKNTQNQ